MVAEGKISFHTCLSKAVLLNSQILRLTRLAVDTNSSFTEMFDHWLLCECLAAIGGRTVM